MKLILIMGIQGSGKSTLAQSFKKHFGIVHKSTGDLLRKHIEDETDFGKMYKSAYERGELAPDEVLYGIIDDTLSGYFKDETILLDGFPRNMKQLEWLESKYNISECIFIKIPIQVATERLLNRKRSDDTKASIKKRFSLYREHTMPIIKHYRNNKKLITINGNKPTEEMTKECVEKMGGFLVI